MRTRAADGPGGPSTGSSGEYERSSREFERNAREFVRNSRESERSSREFERNSKEFERRSFERTDSGSQSGSLQQSHDTSFPDGQLSLSRYLGPEVPLQYEDFDVKSKEYRFFRCQDYSWDNDGFELTRRLLPVCAGVLDSLFRATYELTYNQFAGKQSELDTAPFRRAVWHYVQRIKGMLHDDYNYQHVNVFLNKEVKSYIKKITCVPESITKADYKNFNLDLGHDEKVHVALLAVESSKQCELLYGLHAIMKDSSR
eukprot:TRINITY_DN10394_c0_g1_i1.p2 TRINITY_DN10394_c0_g1~~TRINITY_DN10394_c0_g1_i1.p2  ORF type:complete len:258 (-),score=101.05 TRINITY_DN10394_c0_g1_i1:182-955(-)